MIHLLEPTNIVAYTLFILSLISSQFSLYVLYNLGMFVKIYTKVMVRVQMKSEITAAC